MKMMPKFLVQNHMESLKNDSAVPTSKIDGRKKLTPALSIETKIITTAMREVTI